MRTFIKYPFYTFYWLSVKQRDKSGPEFQFFLYAIIFELIHYTGLIIILKMLNVPGIAGHEGVLLLISIVLLSVFNYMFFLYRGRIHKIYMECEKNPKAWRARYALLIYILVLLSGMIACAIYFGRPFD